MKILSFLEKDIKYFFVILGISGFLQFMFSEAFIFPSALPIHIPAEMFLLRTGAVSFYIFFISLILVSFLLSNKVKALLPLSILLIISPILAYLNVNYTYYYGIEIFVIIIAITALIEATVKSSIKVVLLIPSGILVGLGLIASFFITFYHTTLYVSYLDFLIFSAVTFLVYTILWRRITSKRSIIAYIVGLMSMYPFIMFAHEIITNKYIQILMEMILPSALGITIYNPSHLLYLVYFLGIITFSIISIIIKGNGSAGIGYFMLISNVFFGIYGYLLLMYMLVPTIGYVLMCYNEMKEESIIKYLSQKLKVKNQ
ncbi:cytochrome b558/566 subunit B [Sulfurisphaera ohwakuensis]|uniref:Cytochrome b558/566 subunit B n=1 Tax=Sulfurisphaera ohwakuensis TaxID=69656 RepID=A0A650CHU0_SULOH|nr:cytochrome b558/566 subunit B [Sulfurisphaera ohwakuensis]MBB5253602.1 cytochrome b558/566 subunit B [Sulfurisphaera ohwakuensis]QGR17380.1 cytochrome b558/566 subunit B [Sulfurisphaera ohwakuensis]